KLKRFATAKGFRGRSPARCRGQGIGLVGPSQRPAQTPLRLCHEAWPDILESVLIQAVQHAPVAHPEDPLDLHHSVEQRKPSYLLPLLGEVWLWHQQMRRKDIRL